MAHKPSSSSSSSSVGSLQTNSKPDGVSCTVDTQKTTHKCSSAALPGLQGLHSATVQAKTKDLWQHSSPILCLHWIISTACHSLVFALTSIADVFSADTRLGSCAAAGHSVCLQSCRSCASNPAGTYLAYVPPAAACTTTKPSLGAQCAGVQYSAAHADIAFVTLLAEVIEVLQPLPGVVYMP